MESTVKLPGADEKKIPDIMLPQFPDIHIRLVFAEKQNADVPKRVREILKHSYLERRAVS